MWISREKWEAMERKVKCLDEDRYKQRMAMVDTRDMIHALAESLGYEWKDTSIAKGHFVKKPK